MSKLEKLTKEQEDLIPVIRDKWINLALHGGTKIDKEEVTAGIKWLYYSANLKEPEVVFINGPKDFSKKWGIKKASVWASVGDSVRDSVGDSVRDSVWASVGDSVRDSGYGQHDANWLGFYDYFNNVVKLEKQTEKLKGLWIIAQSANWFIPHKNICWISERHDVCKLKDGKIHADGGPAIHYPDGFSVWALNGVRVPQIIAETPTEKLDAKLLLKEQNAEVRREIVRKIGIERICQKLNAKMIDKTDDGMYELLMLDLGDGRSRPYLKMRNPSIGVYHIEGVEPGINTVEKALNWRNQSPEKPLALT